MTDVTLRWARAGLLLLPLAAGCSTFDDGPERWSEEWYAENDGPVGTRQKYHAGKAWPPYPRPVGEEMECSTGFHAAHYWPLPYVCYDRAYVREISEIQVNNGWIAEATLYDFHFDPDTCCLNQAGLLHLKWILESCPAERRCAWIQNAATSDKSEMRVNSVREQAIAMVGEANVPPVMLRAGSTEGRPAAEIDALRRTYQSVQRPPQIEYTALPSGSNGGGGS